MHLPTLSHSFLNFHTSPRSLTSTFTIHFSFELAFCWLLSFLSCSSVSAQHHLHHHTNSSSSRTCAIWTGLETLLVFPSPLHVTLLPFFSTVFLTRTWPHSPMFLWLPCRWHWIASHRHYNPCQPLHTMTRTTMF